MRLGNVWIGALGVLCTFPAQAMVNAQLIGGQRTATVKQTLSGDEETTDVQAQEIGLALHTDPIPAAPVSFGVAVLQQNYDLKPAAEKRGTPGL